MINSIFLFLFLISSFALAASPEEIALQKSCSNSDLMACEGLTAFYIKNEKWDNAYVLGEALCSKEVMKGCTFAGTALLAKGNSKEGVYFLTKACDGFEPYACRSLARLMKTQNRQDLVTYMYNKRACYYGLNESCKNLKKPKDTYSPKGIEFMKEVAFDCEDSNSPLCQSRLKTLDNCSKILSEDDCLLIPGELSIYFRAMLIQESAKLTLKNIVDSQNVLKENPKQKRYTYDLKQLLKDHKSSSAYIYVFGFQKVCTKKYERAKDAESTSLALYKDSYSTLSSRTKTNIAAFYYKGKADECYDPQFGYESFAVANLDPLNPARLDIWKTNRDGNMVHIQNGLPLP
jgi:hypothetical protein